MSAIDHYPNRPLRFIVPYAVGGPGDMLARLLEKHLGERWKQAVLVENIGGNGGMTGSAEALKAPADGYTLILAAAPHSINPAMYKSMPYDPLKDFQAVTLMISMPNMLIINNSLPFKSVAELIAYARAHPGELKYASSGVGTPSHLGAELLKNMAGVDITHVEYKGHAAAGAALQAGEASMLFDAILLALPEVKAGHVQGLAVTSAERSRVAADIPSVAESGLPGFDFSPGAGVLVRAGTDMAIVNKLYEAIRDIVHIPEVAANLAGRGANVVANTPAQFGAYIESEIAKWARVVKAANITQQ